MKAENPYLKVIKERYLSLIVAPIVIVGGMFYYFHIAGILVYNEFELLPFFSLIVISFFVLIQSMKFIICLFNKNFSKAFGLLIRLLLIVVIVTLYKIYFMPHITLKIENFEKEKQYYLRPNTSAFNMYYKKGRLALFGLQGKEGTSKCGIVYDEADTLLNDSHHRGIGDNWIPLQGAWKGGWSRSHTRPPVAKTYMIPTNGYKIEPNLYYICFDFDKRIEIKNYKTKEQK